MAYRIITVSREFESLGSEIAQETARRLQLPYFDKFLITETAQKLGFGLASVENSDEKIAASFDYSLMEAAARYGSSAPAIATPDQVAEQQFELIRELAEKEACVIVGRCANHVLRERSDVLSVFVHAGRDFRVQKTMQKLHLTESAAVRMLKRTDKARRGYHERYTGKLWNDPDCYHMIINSDKIPFDECVDIICHAYRG